MVMSGLVKKSIVSKRYRTGSCGSSIESEFLRIRPKKKIGSGN